MPIDRDAYRTGGAGPPRPGTGLAFRPGGGGVASWAGGTASTDPLRATLALMAPGTVLRDGLERILRGRTGALIVLGHDRTVESLCTGGFPLDIEFSATRLRELCKMDGAIVLSSDGTRYVAEIPPAGQIQPFQARWIHAWYAKKPAKNGRKRYFSGTCRYQPM